MDFGDEDSGNDDNADTPRPSQTDSLAFRGRACAKVLICCDIECTYISVLARDSLKGVHMCHGIPLYLNIIHFLMEECKIKGVGEKIKGGGGEGGASIKEGVFKLTPFFPFS